MLWKELVKVSLMGTDRNQLSMASLEKLKELGIDLEQDAAQILLEGAGLYAMMRKTGQTFDRYTAEMPTQDGEETDRICPPESIPYLQAILYGDHQSALPELIELLADADQKLPPEMLPELIGKAHSSPDVWTQLRPCIGKRGEWLMTKNPAWTHLIGDWDMSIWETGKKTERIRLLTHLRQTHPAQAAPLVQSTWQSEGIKNKVAFLKCMSFGLSKQEEEFLENCLDEGHKELRRIAAQYLARIPQSAFSQRITIRLQALIQVKKQKGQWSLEIELPENVDDAMIRDGIDPSVQWYRGGLKASRLGQMIALLPPVQWKKITKQNPTENLQAFVQNEYADLLLQAIMEAIVLHRDQEWLPIFLAYWLEHYDEARWQKMSATPLLSMLPNQLFNELTLKGLAMTTSLPEENTPTDLLLKLEQQKWSDDLALSFVKKLQAWLLSDEASSWGGWNSRQILKNAAYQIHPSQFSELAQGWPMNTPIWGGWQKDVEDFLRTLQFRKNLMEQFQLTEAIK